jgi:dTDP-6-deoxy-L-talose 4-dehydrogenase (NAD+)
MSRRVFVTGSTGFVGKQILSSLLEKDVSIVVAVRKASATKLPKSHKLEKPIYTDNIFEENESWWRKHLKDIDTVLHVAWYAEPGKYQYSTENMNCLMGTLRMARVASEYSVKRIVGIGTCLEYAESKQPLAINSPLYASSPYAACKLATYYALSGLAPQYGVEFAWCRLFYLYGEGEDERRLVPTIRKNISQDLPVELTSGNQVRDFLNVREAGQQIAKITLERESGAFNICSGKPVTVREFAQSIADEYGKRDLLQFGARKENPVDPPYLVGIK